MQCSVSCRRAPSHDPFPFLACESANRLQSNQISPFFAFPPSPIFHKNNKKGKKKKPPKRALALAAEQKVSILPKTAHLQPMIIPADTSLGTPKPGLTCPPSGVSSAPSHSKSSKKRRGAKVPIQFDPLTQEIVAVPARPLFPSIGGAISHLGTFSETSLYPVIESYDPTTSFRSMSLH